MRKHPFGEVTGDDNDRRRQCVIDASRNDFVRPEVAPGDQLQTQRRQRVVIGLITLCQRCRRSLIRLEPNA
jgi:hypothetical protein